LRYLFAAAGHHFEQNPSDEPGELKKSGVPRLEIGVSAITFSKGPQAFSVLP